MLRIERCIVLVLFVLLPFGSAELWVAVSPSNGSGNWSVGSTWVRGVAPVEGDDAMISASHAITLTAATSIGNSTFRYTYRELLG